MRRAIAAAVLCLGLAAACGDDPPAQEAASGDEIESPAPSEESLTPTPTPATEESQAPEATDEGETSEGAEGYEGTEDTEGSEDDFSGSEFPPPTRPEHGGTYWGLYFAVVRGGDASDPKLERVADDLRAIGFDPSVSGIDCDQGAKEGLGLDRRHSYSDVALYFESEADAQAFADAYDPGVVGSARVQTFCLD